MGLFNKREPSNSELADNTHKQITNKPVLPQSAASSQSWEVMDGYALIQVTKDKDDYIDKIRCSRCNNEYDKDDFDYWGDIFTFLELHEIKHYLAQGTGNPEPQKLA